MVREALLLDRQGRMPEAITAYQRILVLWPALSDCWYRLAALQRQTRQYSAALNSYRQALDRGVRKPEEVHLNRGVIYAEDLRQDDAAEREFLDALALNAQYVPALINLANLQEDLGRREAALATYEKILELEPHSRPALARYANAKTFTTPGDPVIERLRRALAAPDTGTADRASLGFALGRALDECGEYAAAFDAYQAANRDSRASATPGSAHYDRRAEERRVDRLIAAFPAAAPANVAHAGGIVHDAGIARRTAAGGPPCPIFVCGMFRSGSTLVEQMIAGHPQVVAGGELDFLPYIVHAALAPFPESIAAAPPRRLEALAAQYLHRLGELFPGAQHVTDKRPDNFLYIGLIKRLFPDAKFVHTTRNPLDNCLSLFFLHLDQRMSYALDLMDIGHYYRQYLRLMAHWKALFGADIFDVDYDALVRQPKPGLEQLLAFLGLEWNETCLAPPGRGRSIKTASVWQVREPLHVRSSGRSKHYARELAALRECLEREHEVSGHGEGAC
jgi:tetratricopeptide (TPR) repeat protein